MLSVAAMLGVVFTWLLLALLFFGLGRLVCRTLKVGRNGWSQAHLSFWIGWATAIVVLQVWHLKYPVDHRAMLLISAFGVLGLWIERKILNRQLKSWLRQTERNHQIRVVFAVLLVLAFWASLAIGPPHRPDTANYHLAGVRWNAAYPIVPGLGNLHGRLAFNNSSFLYAAMLDVGLWKYKSHHLAHGLLAVVAILFFLSRVWMARNVKGRKFAVYFMQAFCFPVAVLFTYKGTTSFQPDFITFLLGLIISSLLFELLYDSSLSRRRASLQLFAICFLSGIGLTVKLSFLPLGFLASVMAIAVYCSSRNSAQPVQWSIVAASCLAAILAIGPWTARGVILSGYVAFPSTVGGFEVPWRIPLQDVHLMHDHIVGYARHHGPGHLETLDNWKWVGPAILRELGHPLSVTIPLLSTFLSLGGIYAARRRGCIRSGFRAAPWLFLVPSVAAVLFMLVTAPIPRFAGAAVWVIAIGAMALSLDQLDRSSLAFRRQLRFATALGITLFLVGFVKATRYTNGLGSPSAFAPMPTGHITRMETASGLQINIASQFAWDAPLPNSPEFREDLSLIRSGDLSSGFKIDPRAPKLAEKMSQTHR